MEIVYGALTLCGSDLREGPRGLAVRAARAAQVAARLRAAYADQFDRGNAQTTVTFAVTREFADLAEAQDFALTHVAAVLAVGVADVTFTLADASELTLADALGTARIAAITGVAVEVEYELTGGELA